MAITRLLLAANKTYAVSAKQKKNLENSAGCNLDGPAGHSGNDVASSYGAGP